MGRGWGETERMGFNKESVVVSVPKLGWKPDISVNIICCLPRMFAAAQTPPFQSPWIKKEF